MENRFGKFPWPIQKSNRIKGQDAALYSEFRPPCWSLYLSPQRRVLHHSILEHSQDTAKYMPEPPKSCAKTFEAVYRQSGKLIETEKYLLGID